MLARVGRLLARPTCGTWLASARCFTGLASNPGLQTFDAGVTTRAVKDLGPPKRLLQTTPSSFQDERKLLDILTPEFCQALAEDKTSKKFKLKSIRIELERLYEQDFPLPDSLTEEQWNVLMEFNAVDLRIHYLVTMANFNSYDHLV